MNGAWGMGRDTMTGSVAVRPTVMVNGTLIVDRRDPSRHHAAPHIRRERRSAHGFGGSAASATSHGRGHLRLVPALPVDIDPPSSAALPVLAPGSDTTGCSTRVEASSRSRRAAKRTFDLTVALVLAVLTLPVVLVLLTGSMIAYRANPVFVQRRVGLAGREFMFVKIRSLPQSTPIYTDKYQLAGVANNRWGQTLRRLKLDELPQLWHVVFGRMSLIGPRPEMPGLSASFDRDFVDRRLAVKPGCSGLWQISPDNAGLICEAPHWDLHYAQHWTLRLDLWVIVATLASVPGWMSLQSLGGIPRWTGATGSSATQRRELDQSAEWTTSTASLSTAGLSVGSDARETNGTTFLAGAGH